MDHRPQLEKLAQDFSLPNLHTFFRAACGAYHPGEEDCSGYLQPDTPVIALQKAGQIEYHDGSRLVVVAGGVAQELTSRSGKKQQYELAKKMLKELSYDAGIFIFYDLQGHFRFSLVVALYQGTQRQFSNFRRYTYFVTPDLGNRTFLEQIGKADFSSIETLIQAFSVEIVTKEFFQEYRRIFEQAEAALPPELNAEQKRLYTQKFFNRLMFLAFLERKGWLKFNGRTDYLRALYEDYHQNDPDKRREANFHRKRLNTLFFSGLNNAYERGLLQSDPKYKILRDQIGEVPYLNGGLFEEDADDQRWFFPDRSVAQILSDLLYRFNFTVTESTPLDVEVAVDPEMLGKIFEELVTGRHETGSYYTPKPVVAFMCREALKGYLHQALPAESEAALAQFVDENDPIGLHNPEKMLDALRRVRACDPACGSGAYLLGMLHELLEQRDVLFAARGLDARTVYERKLEIIQNNLYGVDIDPFAVNIARLRLWLSLIVDYEGDNPPPLPNLDFKIEAGDSLTAPDPSGGLELGFRYQLVQDFLLGKEQFLRCSDPSEKSRLRAAIDKLRQDLRNLNKAKPTGKLKRGKDAWKGKQAIPAEDVAQEKAFDWGIEFAEVFATGYATGTVLGQMGAVINTQPGQMQLTPAAQVGGFDIVLANPPYVRADAQFKHMADENERQQAILKWKATREHLKSSNIYQTLYEKWDLYIPFIERAHQLLHTNGQMVFIISDAYNAAKYTQKSHEFFLQNSLIRRIDFCSEIDLFDAGVNNTILHFEKGVPPATHQPLRVRRWGKRDEFTDNFEILNSKPQLEYETSFFVPDSGNDIKVANVFDQLGNICYISYGLRANSDDRFWRGEFVTEDLVSDIQDLTHPRSFIEGKDLIRWWIKKVRYLEWGTERAPKKFARPTFPELHEVSPKLFALVVAPNGPPVALDEKGYITTHTSCIFVPWHLLAGVVNKSINKTTKYRHQNPAGDREQREDISCHYNIKYVLAVMNSSFAQEWLKGERRSKNHVYPDDWKKLPVATLGVDAQQPFVEKVDAILDEYACYGYPLPADASQRVKALEQELDKMVADLYKSD